MSSKFPLSDRAAKLTPEQIQSYREQFEMFDLNGDGVISAKELAKVSRKLGYHLECDQVDEIIKSNDLDKNGVLSFDEFLHAMPGNTMQISDEQHRCADVRRKFLEYDKDGNGFVTMDEAHNILRTELAFSPQQTIELVRKYDINKDGKLSYEEFVKFYAKVKSKTDKIKDMFHTFDTDHSKSISVEEAKIMLQRLDISEDEVELLVATHDKNKDGELQYDEFVGFLLHT